MPGQSREVGSFPAKRW